MSGDISSQEENDIVIEEEGEEKRSLAPASTKKLQAKLKKCVEEKQEYLDGWQRAKADLINQKKDFADRQTSLKTLAQNDLLYSLFPALDSFDMAFRGEAWDRVDETWKKGVEYIHQQFTKAFEEHGIVSFDPSGQSFDPSQHDPIEMKETDTADQDHQIAQVLQVGYKRGDEVIRPAKVIVFEYKK